VLLGAAGIWRVDELHRALQRRLDARLVLKPLGDEGEPDQRQEVAGVGSTQDGVCLA
jgi:hypothetical protein